MIKKQKFKRAFASAWDKFVGDVLLNHDRRITKLERDSRIRRKALKGKK